MTGQVWSLFDSGDGLELALEAKRREATAAADQFDHLLGYLAGWEDEPLVATAGGEELHQYGGSGTPKVAEFAVCEIASALGLSAAAGAGLVADILDLEHRLPRLYAAMHRGDVEAWRVRMAASATRTLSLWQAAAVDLRLSAEALGDGTPMLCRVNRTRLKHILAQIRNSFGPDDADGDHDDAKAERRMSIRPVGDGLTELYGLVSDADGARLNERIEQIVGWLCALGDQRGLGVLRSVAMGYLAEPDSLGILHDQVVRARSRTEPDGSAVASDVFRRLRLPATTVYLHLDRESCTWSMKGVGPISRAEATDIIGHSQVTLKPVIDLAANVTYTGYVAPPKLKERTALLNAGYCTFPSCNRAARPCDYDHIVDYADGGATDARNGHRLCRYHHRAKTFTDWTVRSPAAGTWLWTSPAGRTYLVTGGSTTRLDDHHHRRTSAVGGTCQPSTASGWGMNRRQVHIRRWADVAIHPRG